MKLDRATQIADKILKLVIPRLEKVLGEKDGVTVFPYVNGRERGWTLEVYPVQYESPKDYSRVFTPAVTFAENRGSDELVIYQNPLHFNMHYRAATDDKTVDFAGSIWKRSDFNRERHEISNYAYETRGYFGRTEFEFAASNVVSMLEKQLKELREKGKYE